MRPLLLLALFAALTAHAETVRFAVVVGNNAGSGNMPPLRYAESDAGKFARVLLELGDVEASRLQLLQGKTVKDLEAALAKARADIEVIKRVPENRAVLMFYFSGHSDGEGMELSNEVLLYSRLKSIIANVGDVRLVVVDACRSGAGFRPKGGAPAEAFAIKLTDTLQSTGDAFIASSAESEAALESNEVLGSIFTHHFVSGLRGVADTSGDRLVTLGEAYRYAYDQTVARTALLPAGVQHPSYDYKLSGQGELVLSTLQRATAQLVLPAGMERAVVSDVLRDQVIAELPSPATREVALPAGQYGVRVFKAGQSFGGRISVAEGAHREVKWDELTLITSSTQVAAKGGYVAQAIARQEELWADDHVLGVSGSVVGPIGFPSVLGGARVGFEPRLASGLSFGVVFAMGAKGTVSEGGVEGRVGYRFAWRFGALWLGAGAEVGPAVLWQKSGSVAATSPAGVAAARLSVRFFVVGPLIVTIDGELGGVLYGGGSGLTVSFRPGATMGIAFRF